MRPYAWVAWAACLVVAAALALATALRPFVQPPTLQERVAAIAADVRCPECQGESAAESDAAASVAIREEIARDLEAGLTRHQILQRLESEYGAWILYRPPDRGGFVLLWLAPWMALAAAAAGLAIQLRRARRGGAPGGEVPAPGAVPARMEQRLKGFW